MPQGWECDSFSRVTRSRLGRKQGEILPDGDQSERKRIIRDRGAISISVKPGKAVNRPRPGTTFAPVVGGIEGFEDASRRLLARENDEKFRLVCAAGVAEAKTLVRFERKREVVMLCCGVE
jgi:hypothetical protein